MKTHFPSQSLTVARAFEQFLEVSSFARRTRESYAEDLGLLFTECGQLPITALTADVIQGFLARQEHSLLPPTIGVWPHCGVSPGGFALRDGGLCAPRWY